MHSFTGASFPVLFNNHLNIFLCLLYCVSVLAFMRRFKIFILGFFSLTSQLPQDLIFTEFILCSCILLTIKVFLPMLMALSYISCPSLLCSWDSIWESCLHFIHHIQIFSISIIYWDHDKGHHLPLVFLYHQLKLKPYFQHFFHFHSTTAYLLLFQYLIQEKRLLSLSLYMCLSVCEILVKVSRI